MSSNSNFNLLSILGKENLNGTNFVDWNRNLRIVLRHKKKECVLDTPYPDEPRNVAHNFNVYRAYVSVGIFKHTQINPQAHGYRCSTSRESIPEYRTQGNVCEFN